MSQPGQLIETVMHGAERGEMDFQAPEFGTTEEAFLALEAPLLGYALRLLKEPAMAQDVVQEAFIRLHSEFAAVRDPRRWLYRTVHNLALNQLRRDSKVVPLHRTPDAPDQPADDAADPQLLPDAQIIRIENIGLVRLSLAALDDRCRELVRLKFNEGLSYKQMSEQTGLSVSNVGFLLHNALKTIEAELAKRGVVQ